MLSKKCFCKGNISKIVRPLLAALSVNGLTYSCSELSLTSLLGPMILFKITLELSINWESVCRGVVHFCLKLIFSKNCFF